MTHLQYNEVLGALNKLANSEARSIITQLAMIRFEGLKGYDRAVAYRGQELKTGDYVYLNEAGWLPAARKVEGMVIDTDWKASLKVHVVGGTSHVFTDFETFSKNLLFIEREGVAIYYGELLRGQV